jgi:hypothetical protein
MIEAIQQVSQAISIVAAIPLLLLLLLLWGLGRVWG